MGKMTITVICSKCHTQIEAEYVGTYRDLLKKILQRAGHQPGDTFYDQFMGQINFPGE